MDEEVQNEIPSVKMFFLNTFGLSFWSSSGVKMFFLHTFLSAF
jgi:hypothetical protein